MSLFEADIANAGYMPTTGTELDIFWELDALDDIMPRDPPLPYNYPIEDVVLEDVVYGFLEQFRGTLRCGEGESPETPVISVQGFTEGSVTIAVADVPAGCRAYVLYRRVYSEEQFSDLDTAFSTVGPGSVTITGLMVNITYDFISVTECGTIYSLPSNIVSEAPHAITPETEGPNVFSRVWVDNFMRQGAIIYWEVGELPCNVEMPFQYMAQWSRTINGEWEDVLDVPTMDGFYIIDAEQRLWAKQLDLYYRMKITTYDGQAFYSDPVRADGGLPHEDWVKAREIIRKEYLRLRKAAGSYGKLFRRRDWGGLCPECTDFDTGERVIDNCGACFDTGYIGGYYDPVEYWIDTSVHSQRLQRDDNMGMTGDINKTGRTVPYPFPQSNDVWWSAKDGRRYFLQKIEILSKIRTVPIIISVELRLVPTTSIIYQLPIA